MDWEVLKGREGILSRPKAAFHLREAQDLSNDKDMVEDGE